MKHTRSISVSRLSVIQKSRITFEFLFAATTVFLLLPSAAFSTDLSLLYDGCTLRVPAEIYGKTAYLVVDTGSTISALDKRTYLGRLGDPVAEVPAGSVAGLTTLNLYRSPELLIGDLAAALDRVAAIDLSMIKAISGSECDGVLGTDFVRHHVVSINFDEHLFELRDKIADQQLKGTICLPLKPIGDGNVAVDAIVEGVPITFMIDTGDNGSISLNPQDWQRVVASRPNRDVHMLLAAAVAGSPIQTSGLRINDMSVGPNHYTGFIATAVQNPRGLSTLGLRFLRQHIATFDFQSQKLYLQSGAAFGEKETFDMSGLHLIRSGGDTIVYAVDHGSPADQVRIQPGDALETINSIAAAQMTMRDIRRTLKSNDGATVSLAVRHGTEINQSALRLRKTL